jgi:hypothetical protein
MQFNWRSLLSWKTNLLVSTILCSSVIPINASYSYELLDLEQEIWQVRAPELPSLDNVDAYFHDEDELITSRLVLHLSKRKVEVYQDQQLVATFPVAVGKKGWETPQGEFSVIQMIKNPTWEHPWNGTIFPPGPKNPLGERWIGFWTDGKNYIGFHGTPQENLIGQAVSHGCVRMKNQDIKQLFELVYLGITVTVKN